MLRLADALGSRGWPSSSRRRVARGAAPARPYAVIHAAPMFRYKRWTATAGARLPPRLRRGLAIVATGGPADRHELDGPGRGIRTCSGSTAAELAGACGAAPRRAGLCRAGYVGDPSRGRGRRADRRALWADRPAPVGALAGRRARCALGAAGRHSARGNVWLVQNALPCMPCQQEGCARHLESHSRCLDELTVQHVLRAVDRARGPRGGAAA